MFLRWQVIAHNFTHSTIEDRCRIITMFAVLAATLLLFPVLLCKKLDAEVQSGWLLGGGWLPWPAVFAPLFLLEAIWLALQCAALVAVRKAYNEATAGGASSASSSSSSKSARSSSANSYGVSTLNYNILTGGLSRCLSSFVLKRSCCGALFKCAYLCTNAECDFHHLSMLSFICCLFSGACFLSFSLHSET
jgi:hypothetical protein